MEAGAVTPGGAKRELKPLDVGQTLDAAINLYTKNATRLWALVAIVFIPVYILETIIRRLTLPSDVFLHNGTLYTHGSTTSSALTVGYIVVGLLGLFGQLLATGGVFKFQLDAYLGRQPDISDSYQYAFGRHRLLSLLWIGIIATVMIVVGFILLIIPGIYVFVAVSVAVPVLMLEGLHGMKAISRSMSLVGGRWWATFGRLLVGLILYAVAVFIIGAIAKAIASGSSNVTVFEIINGAVGAIISIILAPFIAALINVIYIDLRVRKEGADEAVLISGATPSGPPPGVDPLTTGAAEPPAEPPATEPRLEPPASEPPPSQPPPTPGA